MKLPICMFALMAPAVSAFSQEAAPIAVTVDVSRTSAPVSEEEFGMFIEHIGTLVYDSLWSELLDDRKFFGPILESEPEVAPGPRSPFRRELRKWVAVGGNYVTLDAVEPYAGEHSPCIALDTAQPRGIRQSGFALIDGKAYTGRIVLRASAGARVVVSLVRDGGVRESVVIEPTGSYEKYPLAFAAGAASTGAALEITATGEGTLHIGAVSLMPADNVEGFRPDVIALLKDLDSGMWRLPGGNVISAWSWYDSIGDIDRRPSYFDPVWNALQTNDVGLDEYMTLCRLIGVEPYITVSAGFGDSHSAAEQVEYINGAATTHMGAQRAANGHPEPYGVRYWNIGNEPYGSWQFGRTDLCFYVYKHNEFARAMRKVDPSIVLLASGSMPDRLWKDPEVPIPYDTTKETIGTEWDWTGGLFAHCMDNFDGMTEHWYAPAGMKYDPANAPGGVDLMFAGYVKMDYTLLEWVRYPSNRVRVKAEQWDQYRRLFPEIDRQGKFLSIDEYAFMAWQPSLKTALAYGMVFNEMLRHTEFLRMSAFTMGTSTLDIAPDCATYNANGLVFKLYGDRRGGVPVALTGYSPQPAPKFPIDGDQPRVNAGSPTYPLDMVATLEDGGKTLVLSVINATEDAIGFDLAIDGAKLAGQPTLRVLSGPSLEAANHAGKPAELTVSEVPVTGDAGHLTVAPCSISIFRLPVCAE